MNKSELSIATSFNYQIPIEEQIPLIAEAGFTHIMISGGDRHSGYLSKKGREKLKALLDQYSLKIDTIHGPRQEIVSTLDVCKDAKKLNPVIEAAKDFGVSIIVLHEFDKYKFKQDKYQEKFNELLSISKDLKALGEKEDIIFALENMHPGAPSDAVRDTILTLDSPNIGFCYDVSHDYREGSKPLEILYALKEKTVSVHISDKTDLKDEKLEHFVPGMGFIHWDDVAKGIRETDFSGPIVLEVNMKSIPDEDPKKFLKRTYDSGVRLYKKIFG